MKNKILQRIIYRILKAINSLFDKYQLGLPDCSELNETEISWINEKYKKIWENIKNTKFKTDNEEFQKIYNEIINIEEGSSAEKLNELLKKSLPKLEPLKRELEKAVQKETENSTKRQFQAFGPDKAGDALERQQLLDAMEDSCDMSVSKYQKVEFPENIYSKLAEKTLNDILNKNSNLEYIQKHEGLSQNIQTDLVDWMKQADRTLQLENPFIDEEQYLAELKGTDSRMIRKNFGSIKENVLTLQDETSSKAGMNFPDIKQVDFDFYNSKIVELSKIKDKTSRKAEERAIAQKFNETYGTNVIERKNKWESKRLDELKKQFEQELLDKIEQFKKLEERLSDICFETGFLWDMAKGTFKDSGFEILKKYADLLNYEEGLQELARLLGKHNQAEIEYEKELREKTTISTEFNPKPASKGRVVGIKFDNDLSSVLPCELALLNNPKTKKLFELKYAQKQLLCFNYEMDESNEKSQTEYEEVTVEKGKKEEKGPIIICVDTSGSMQGTPERVAKTITFALAKIAIQEKRKCYLINFSTSIETLDLGDFSAEGETPLATLAKFLKMSFNGGTDLEPAMEESLKMLREENYENADVLMISDMQSENLSSGLVRKIKAEQAKNTDFYSLVIGGYGNQNVMNCFDHNWVYNETDPNASRNLAEQIHEFKKHKN